MNVCFSATGLFHDGKERRLILLGKVSFFLGLGEQVSFICLFVSAPSKRRRTY